ncbi:cupin domain-containing protein [Hyalangium versicolor]|uniref:cupin domain-containing protein n=1 Tax=Hyalangium versicolor TaxID=2861190 RepID=UPI001CCA58B3|nr:cupin domain-containing protein [Hyalangium versicolor]
MSSTVVPSFIVHALDVPEQEGAYRAPFDGEKLSFDRNLGQAAGTERFGLRHERLPPGRRTSFTHAHSHEEELVYVLEGECHVRLIEPGALEPREIPLRAGHVVSFRSGTGIAHCFVNHGASDCLLLTVGERRRGVDRCVYPEDTAYNDFIRSTRPERFWDR